MAYEYNQTIPVYVQQQQYAQAPPPAQAPIYPVQQVHQQYVQPIHPMHITTVQAVILPMFGRHPTRMTCPACHAEIMTTVRYDVSQKTHIIALLMCFFTGCCCLPYCFNMCKTATHFCPNCNNFLGTHNDGF